MNALRFALLGLLVYLPFQQLAIHAWEIPLAIRSARWVDEIALAILLPAALVMRVRTGRPWRMFEMSLAGSIGAFALVCAVSTGMNDVPVHVAVLGTVDYVKGFVYVFVFGVICADRAWLSRSYRTLFVIALLGAACAIGQEILWLLRGEGPPMRLGIYRARSFFGHPNGMGLYLLVLFVLAAFQDGRPRGSLLLLYAGLALSVSRMVHAAFALIGTLLFVSSGRRWLIPLIVVSTSVVIATSLPTLEKSLAAVTSDPKRDVTRVAADINFRGRAFHNGVKAWRMSPVIGLGPGRFGGVVSVLTDSPVYRELPWTPHEMRLVRRFRSLDQFPVQLLAELGVVGALGFACVCLSVWYSLWRSRRPAQGFEQRIVNGLLLAWLVLPVYSLGSGLNQAHVLITLSALSGAVLGRLGDAEDEAPARPAPQDPTAVSRS